MIHRNPLPRFYKFCAWHRQCRASFAVSVADLLRGVRHSVDRTSATRRPMHAADLKKAI